MRSLSVSRIIELNGGQSPLTYKRFQTLISRMDPVEISAETITAEVMGKCATPISEDHDDKFGVPSLEELGETPAFLKFSLCACVCCRWDFESVYVASGFETEGLSTAVWPGGETEALTRLERHLERKVSIYSVTLSYSYKYRSNIHIYNFNKL